MRKKIFILLITGACLLVSIPQQSQATPITAIITTVVKKVLRAMDLAIQRLQNETIKLQNAQKVLENTLNKLKLKEIFEWGEQQHQLFSGFYDELWRVKSAIAYAQRVKDIVMTQKQLVEEYQRAIRLFANVKQFTPDKLAYINEVYSGILAESIKNVDQVFIVINSFSTQMSDAARLELIHATAAAIDRNLSHLRRFTNENILLSLQQVKDETELKTLKGLYGLPQ